MIRMLRLFPFRFSLRQAGMLRGLFTIRKGELTIRIGRNSTIEEMGRSGIAERFRRNDSLLRKKILSYLPFMLMTNLATLLLVSVDGLVVGNLVGSSALASVSIFAPIATVFGIFTTIVSSGISTALSTGMGSGRLDELSSQKRAARFLTMIAALVVGVIQVPITRLLIAAYRLSPDMQALVWQYSIGIMLSMPFGLVSTICVYELQILGHTKILTVLAAAEGIVNLALDLLFVGVMKLGVAGAGYGTAAATIIRCIISVVYLYRKTDIYRCGDAKLRGKDIWQILRTGLSEASYVAIVAVQAFFMIKLLLATFGESGGMVDAVCNFCFTLASLVVASVGASARPLFGIITGGKDVEGLRLLMRQSIMMMAAALSAFTLIVLAVPGMFYQLHGVTEIPDYGLLALRLYALHFVFNGVNSIYRLYFANRGEVAYSSAASIIGYATPLLFAWLLSLIYAPLFWLCYFVSESVLLLANILRYRVCIQEDMKEVQPGEEFLYLTVRPQDAIEASRSIRQYAEAHGFSERIAYRAALCMEEMVHYAASVNGSDDVNTQVTVKFFPDKCIFTIMDDGKCILLNEDDESKELALNYSMIRKIASSVSYQYLLNMNYTVFTFEEKPAQNASAAVAAT